MPRIRRDGRRLAFQQFGGRYEFQLMTVPLDRDGRPIAERVMVDHGLDTAPIAWVGTDLVFFSRVRFTTSLHRWSRPEKSQICVLPISMEWEVG